MRLLVLAGILSLLAGCSLPYEGTSFKANPELEAALRGHGKEESHAEGEKTETQTESIGSSPVFNDSMTDLPVTAEKSPLDQTGAVFPPTAQPGE